MNTFENLENLNVSEECLDDILSIIEGLFVNDGRGDLLNDIDNALGSPVKKTAKDMVKQCTGCKQKKVNEVFDNSKEKVYDKNNIINLLEEIINEVSDKFIRDKIKNSEEGIDNNEEIKKQLRTEESKKKVDDIEIPLKHKLEVLKNKFEDRVMKRAKAEEDDSKKKEGN